MSNHSVGIWGGEFVVTVSNRYKVTAKAFIFSVEIFNAVAAMTYSGSFRVDLGNVVESMSSSLASGIGALSGTIADVMQVVPPIDVFMHPQPQSQGMRLQFTWDEVSFSVLVTLAFDVTALLGCRLSTLPLPR